VRRPRGPARVSEWCGVERPRAPAVPRGRAKGPPRAQRPAGQALARGRKAWLGPPESRIEFHTSAAGACDARAAARRRAAARLTRGQRRRRREDQEGHQELGDRHLGGGEGGLSQEGGWRGLHGLSRCLRPVVRRRCRVAAAAGPSAGASGRGRRLAAGRRSTARAARAPSARREGCGTHFPPQCDRLAAARRSRCGPGRRGAGSTGPPT
jgi:hypothetical protein